VQERDSGERGPDVGAALHGSKENKKMEEQGRGPWYRRGTQGQEE